jgi:hypothetical protein
VTTSGAHVHWISDEIPVNLIGSATPQRALLSCISLMRGGDEPGIIEKWKLVAGREPNEENDRSDRDCGG